MKLYQNLKFYSYYFLPELNATGTAIITLIVSDGETVPVSTTIGVEVIDLVDAPYFDPLLYNMEVYEDDGTHSQLFKITDVDVDSGDESFIDFTLIHHPAKISPV